MPTIKYTYFFIFVFLDVCFATLPMNKYIQDDSLSDRTCSGSNQLFTISHINTIKCAFFCERKHQCSGFTFRSTDGKCSVCQNGLGELTAVQDGMEYFGIKSSTWGTACSSDDMCSDANQMCMDEACICIPGYSFQNSTWSCVAGCSRYGDTFQKYVGYRIGGHNLIHETPCTISRCKDLCRVELYCVSFDFSYNATKSGGETVCNLNTVSALDVPSKYVEHSNWQYHQRNCA